MLKRRIAGFAAASLLVLSCLMAQVSTSSAAQTWNAYTYNSVATVTAAKGLAELFDEIGKRTKGELTIKLHLGGTLQIKATDITPTVADNIGTLLDFNASRNLLESAVSLGLVAVDGRGRVRLTADGDGRLHAIVAHATRWEKAINRLILKGRIALRDHCVSRDT